MTDKDLDFMHFAHFASRMDLSRLFRFLKSNGFSYERELGYWDLETERIMMDESDALKLVNEKGGEVVFLRERDDLMIEISYLTEGHSIIFVARCAEMPDEKPPHLEQFMCELADFLKNEYPLTTFVTNSKTAKYRTIAWIAKINKSLLKTAIKTTDALKKLIHFSCNVTFVTGKSMKLLSMNCEDLKNKQKELKKYKLESIYFTLNSKHKIHACIFTKNESAWLEILLDNKGWFEEDRLSDIRAANRFIRALEKKLGAHFDLETYALDEYLFLDAKNDRLKFKTDDLGE